MLRAAVHSNSIDTEIAKKRAELEREIIRQGKAVCNYCGEEIYNNPTMISAGYTWESESMLGWCDKSRNNKHAPKIELKEEDDAESL